MDDKEIVELYFARSESAIAETEKKYGRYCKYIANQILSNDADADEAVNDTYLKTWNTVPPNRPENLKIYVGMITRQLALDTYEKQHTQKRVGGEVSLMLDELSECISDNTDSSDIGESIALRDALNTFLASLPDRTQIIFLRRYWYAMPISDIAKDLSMKQSSVAVLLFRTRNQLKNHLKKEGFEV